MTIREGVTKGDPLLMVLYMLSLLSLSETMGEADLGVLQPWCADDAAMRVIARHNAKLLCALMTKFPYRGYFPELEKGWQSCG